jgi:hemerythrin-like domain-containing protein
VAIPDALRHTAATIVGQQKVKDDRVRFTDVGAMVTKHQDKEYTLNNAYIWFLIPCGSNCSMWSDTCRLDRSVRRWIPQSDLFGLIAMQVFIRLRLGKACMTEQLGFGWRTRNHQRPKTPGQEFPRGGHMDVIDLLVADHNRVRGLISRYKDADEADKTAEAAELADLIIGELKVHMTAEEDVFYQAVKKRTSEIKDDVEEGYEEHHVAKVLIDEIGDLKAGSDTWVAKMTVLIESVEHHVDEEEDELFPSVRSSTDAARREKLGQEFDEKRVSLGATPLDDKLELSTADLHEKASKQDIPGRSKMDHDELAATVDVLS